MNRCLLTIPVLFILSLPVTGVAGNNPAKPCVTSVYASPPTIAAGQKAVINATTNKAAARAVLRFTDTVGGDLAMTGRDHMWSVTIPAQHRPGSRAFTVTAFDASGGSGETKTGVLLVKAAPSPRQSPTPPPKQGPAPVTSPTPAQADEANDTLTHSPADTDQ